MTVGTRPVAAAPCHPDAVRISVLFRACPAACVRRRRSRLRRDDVWGGGMTCGEKRDDVWGKAGWHVGRCPRSGSAGQSGASAR